MHGPVRHGTQVDQQSALFPGEEKLQIHLLGFIFSFTKKRWAWAKRSVLMMLSLYSMLGEPLIVTLVRSGKMNFSEALSVRLHEQEEDNFHQPSLDVYFDV